MGFPTGLEVLFLLTMMNGGVNDYLDLIPSEQYWQSKSVQISEDAMKAELVPPRPVADISRFVDSLADEAAANREAAARSIREMGPGAIPQLQKAIESGNPEIAARARRLIQELQASGGARQVRTLMAIRTAGERKMRGLLPRLQDLQQSQAAFVADYASAAVAAMDGKPYVRQHTNCSNDPWVLPERIRGVLHMEINGSGSAFSNADLQRVMGMLQQKHGQNGANQLQQLIGQLINIADKTGNIRIEGLTMGISGDVGPRNGYVVILAHGQFDAGTIAELVAQASGKQIEMIEGCPSIQVERSGKILFPNNHFAAMIFGPPEMPLPVKEVLDGIKSGKSGLKDVAEVKQLAGTIDTTATIWGFLQFNNAMRELPLFKNLDTLTLVGKMKERQTDFTFVAMAQNAQDAAGVVGMVNRELEQGKNGVRREMVAAPNADMRELMQVMVDLLDSIKFEQDPADAKRATLTGRLKGSPMSLIMGFIGFTTVSKQMDVPPQPVAPVPPPPPPPRQVLPEGPREFPVN